MTTGFKITIREGFWERYSETFNRTVELGRQDALEPEPYSKLETENKCKLIIASALQTAVSRELVRVSPRGADAIHLQNISKKVSFELAGSEQSLLEPLTSRKVMLPVEIKIGELLITIEQAAVIDDSLESFGWQIEAPNAGSDVMDMASRTMTLEGYQDQIPAEFLPWLKDAMQICMNVFQSALNSDAFFHEGARAVVTIAAMDSGQVLLRNGDSWINQTIFLADPSDVEAGVPSQRVLKKVLDEKRTCWQLPQGEGSVRGSIVDISAVVAAPILNTSKEVIGVLYADRRLKAFGAQTNINKLEALLVEMLACGIATGLSRLGMEKAQVQYEQFFTPALAKRLIEEPDLLKGNDRPITVMFCDISGFSAISERLQPAITLDWIHDCLSHFSGCVLATGGVLVDYVGDELMAMWVAPDPVDDHAERACRAAIDIMRSLNQINLDWESTIGAETNVCIGVNSGPARVGNTGSKQKFKYGALGNTVNLAARVQSASKHLRSRLIISGATSRLLPISFQRRRLCQVRVKGIAAPVQLFELCDNNTEAWAHVQSEYERSLEAAEGCHLQQAITTLGNLLENSPNDGPTLVLLERLVKSMIEGHEQLDPVWELPSK